MIKRIIILVAAAGILTAGCTSNDNDHGTTTTTADHTETTVTTSSSSVATKAFCDDESQEIGDLFEQYAAALGDTAGGQAEIQAAVRTGHKLVELGNTFLDVCGHYYSSEAVADLRVQLNDLESNITQMERTTGIYG